MASSSEVHNDEWYIYIYIKQNLNWLCGHLWRRSLPQDHVIGESLPIYGNQMEILSALTAGLQGPLSLPVPQTICSPLSCATCFTNGMFRSKPIMEFSTIQLPPAAWGEIKSKTCVWLSKYGVFLIAMFMGPTWGLSGADMTQVSPILAPWTLLSGGSHMSNAYLPYLVMLVKQYQLLSVETVAGIRGVLLYIYVRSKKFQLSEQTRANVHYLYFIWHTWHEMWMFTCKHWERTRPRWTQPTHGTTDIPIRRKLNLVKIDS